MARKAKERGRRDPVASPLMGPNPKASVKRPVVSGGIITHRMETGTARGKGGKFT